MTNKCIINFATGRYIKGQDRLRNSLLEVRFDGDLLCWTSEAQIGAPLHKDNPYAFKVYCFDEAIRLGYTQIVLVDASVWAVSDVTPIFDHIEREGYIMQEAGQHVGRWTNDKCLDYFGLTREEANKMLMYGNAGFLGLNFETEIANKFFSKWKSSMQAGIFKGDWSNHRHDMVCGSIIANHLDMKYQSAHYWLNYGTTPRSDKVYLLAQGV